MSRRNLVLYLTGALVLVAAIGAIYLEILVQSHSTHHAWIATERITAGSPLTALNVRQVEVPETGDHVLYYAGNPVTEHRRAGHGLNASHMLADDDLLGTEMVLAPVAFKAAPTLARGDVVDVFYLNQQTGRTIQVGRSVLVESATTIWVRATDEPSWVALQANNALLFAVAGAGNGVPASSGTGVALPDAVGSLSTSSSAQAQSPPSPRP